MKPKHTKGPWKVFYATNGSMLGVGVDRPKSEKHGMGVTDAFGGLWGDGAEKKANAHLIATSPELFAIAEEAIEILEVAIDLWNSVHGKGDDEVFGDLKRRCVEAVAKAKVP